MLLETEESPTLESFLATPMSTYVTSRSQGEDGTTIRQFITQEIPTLVSRYEHTLKTTPESLRNPISLESLSTYTNGLRSVLEETLPNIDAGKIEHLEYASLQAVFHNLIKLSEYMEDRDTQRTAQSLTNAFKFAFEEQLETTTKVRATAEEMRYQGTIEGDTLEKRINDFAALIIPAIYLDSTDTAPCTIAHEIRNMLFNLGAASKCFEAAQASGVVPEDFSDTETHARMGTLRSGLENYDQVLTDVLNGIPIANDNDRLEIFNALPTLLKEYEETMVAAVSLPNIVSLGLDPNAIRLQCQFIADAFEQVRLSEQEVSATATSGSGGGWEDRLLPTQRPGSYLC